MISGLCALLLLAPQGASQTRGPQADPAPATQLPEGRGALLGSVASGRVTAEVLPLSLPEAIERGLRHNLALLLSEQGVRRARGARWEALSDLLPHFEARFAATRQKINLEAFGFTNFPGVPTLIGPFNVFDSRLLVSQKVLDLEALYKTRAEREALEAARYSYQDTRDLVVLVCGNLYLQALAEESRIEAARSEVETARALHELASDRKSAGLSPAIDVLRAEVELASRKQQLIAAESRFDRAKLSLARAIGLPLGQAFRLTDRMPEAPAPVLSVEEALRRAYDGRADWKSALAAVRAAEASRKSALGDTLPTIDVTADYGAIGQTIGGALATYSLGAAVRVPLLKGGHVAGKLLAADAVLEARRASLEDLRGAIDYEVRTAALDLRAAAERVGVAQGALSLAREQLQQAQDRFEAGVANNIDVVQAQEAVAAATESHISSVYDHNFAKAALARALGVAEEAYLLFLRGD